MEFPNTGLSRAEIAAGPWCGEGKSIVVTDKGLKLVSLAGWFRAMGIPKDPTSVKAAKFLAEGNAAVKWENGEEQMEYQEAA